MQRLHRWGRLVCWWLLAAWLPLAVNAQDAAAEPPPVPFSQEQLDQLMAPVALYPDTLLTQVLIAATYPLELVQADRFLKANPELKGEALATAVPAATARNRSTRSRTRTGTPAWYRCCSFPRWWP